MAKNKASEFEETGKTVRGSVKEFLKNQLSPQKGTDKKSADKDATDKEAGKKYSKYKSKDPFKDVAPSLLNHEQIIAYIYETGMISPFHAEDLKGVTYDARIDGKCVYWEYVEDGVFSNKNDIQNVHKRFKKKIVYVQGDPDDPNNLNREIIIKPNSIVFITLEPTFRIPDYIVLRYNFRIKNVYRGLLLGTGPIIDPGFEGKLSIPIHNLTNNEYRFKANEAIISIEFTKIQVTPQEIKDDIEGLREKHRKEKPQILENKLWVKDFSNPKTVEDYIYNSLKDQPVDTVGNSIPAVSSIIEECNKNVKEESKKTESKLKKFEIIGILGVVVALATLALPTWSAFSDIQRERVEYNQTISSYEEQIDILEENVLDLLISDCEKELAPFLSQIDNLSSDIKEQVLNIAEKLEELKQKLDKGRHDSTKCEEMIHKAKEIKADIATLKEKGE